MTVLSVSFCTLHGAWFNFSKHLTSPTLTTHHIFHCVARSGQFGCWCDFLLLGQLLLWMKSRRTRCKLRLSWDPLVKGLQELQTCLFMVTRLANWITNVQPWMMTLVTFISWLEESWFYSILSNVHGCNDSSHHCKTQSASFTHAASRFAFIYLYIVFIQLQTTCCWR